MPNELTATRRGRAPVSGHRVASPTTRTGSSSQPISGFGVRKWRCAGIASAFSVKTALINPAIPAAASRCPMFVFTDPTSSGRDSRRPRP